MTPVVSSKRQLPHGTLASADYTLLCPASGHDVLDDIKDLFTYLSTDLNLDLAASGCERRVDASSIIVAGSSAGGLCAYLAALHATPKPKGVLSLYGMGGDFLVSKLDCLACTFFVY